jgi:hypothetical protein
MQRRFLYILCVLAIAALSGCASMFRSSPPSVEIIGPDKISVENKRGQPIRLYKDGPETYAHPEPRYEDSIVISNLGRSHAVALAKRMSPWILLDLLSDGLGFVIDDFSNYWYNYMPVYVHPDSTGSDFSVSSSNWLGEPAGRKRPDLLVLGGIGTSVHTRPQLPDLGALLGPQFSFYIKFQGGLGVDLYKQLELFYLAQDEPGYDLDPNASLFLGRDAEVTSQSIAGRYFVHDNFFVQGSFGWGHASTDTIRRDTAGHEIQDADGYAVFDQSFSNSFPVIGLGIGWAGDISYVALQYAVGTKRFSIYNSSDISFHSIFLDFGMNLRF